MDMSDTPETDASCGYALSSHYGRLEGSYLQMDRSGPFVHAEVARKLERERNEARSELSLKQQTLTIAEGTLSDIRKQRDDWAAMCGRYKQERDMAEKYVKNYQTKMFELIDERDKTKQERDEALELIDDIWITATSDHRFIMPPSKKQIPQHIEGIIKAYDKAHDDWTPEEIKTLMRERDEARELVYAWESRWKAEVEFAAKVSVKRDELQDILRKLLGIIPEPECHDFGHTKEERHTFFEKCPVMERYDALIAQAKEAAK
jgi:hypothetical protein